MPSECEMDQVPIGPEIPNVWVESVLLTGLGTHQMALCDLGLAECTFAVADPSCRRLWCSLLRPEQRGAYGSSRLSNALVVGPGPIEVRQCH